MTLAGRLSPARALLAALGALVLTFAFAATAKAATTFTVNTTADNPAASGECTGGPSSGDCSLRQALDASGGDEGDTILIPPGDYVLTHGELTLTTAVTIKGTPGDSPATTTVDAQNKSRVFDVAADTSTPGSVIEGLTVTGGNASDAPEAAGFGGGIYAGTPLTLINDVVTGNQTFIAGGGIASRPISFFAPHGAAPTFSSEPLTVSSSLIAGNRVLGLPPVSAPKSNASIAFAIGGGGISSSGGVSLTNSTVADNSVDVNGNDETAGGGGILSELSADVETLNVTVNNNTVTGSTGSGGGGIAGGFVDLARRTSIALGANFTAQNTIVSRDHVTISGTTTLEDCANVSTTSDANISTDASCGFTDSASRQNTDPGYTSASPQENGGLTGTLGINEASPAFNTGDGAGAPNVDQRGVSRPQAGAWDIGAFEYVPSTDLQITKTGTPATVTVGHNITYTLTVRNNGPDPASGVTVADTLPISETLVSATPSEGTCSATTCSLGNLGSGASATITIVARANAVGSVTNTATVHGNESDPNPANNTAAATNGVAAPQSLAHPSVHASAAPCYRNAVALSVSISSKAALKGVRVLLNGKLIETTKKKHFTIHISKLNRTHNTLTIVARNSGGKSPTKHITLRRCPTPKPRFTG